jgi:hypothetical protein
MSGGFNFGGPASTVGSTSSGNSKNSYSGSFLSSVSPSDSVSNAGSLVQSVASLQLNPVAAGGSGGSTSGGSGSSSFVSLTVPSFYGLVDWKDYCYNYGTFCDQVKNPYNFVAGPVIKCHHLTTDYKELTAELHMQYLHIVELHVSSVPDNEKATTVSKVNKLLFEEHEPVNTNWGTGQFYKNFKNFIMKPVVNERYNGVLDDAFFRPNKGSEVQPLSKMVFEHWLTR